MLDENKLDQIKQMIATAEDAIRSAKQMLEKSLEKPTVESAGYSAKTEEIEKISNEGRIIEGVFDGLNLIGPEGKQYNVPANYASKSKLVEGDILKLTIADDGSFVYKQIGPVERKRLVGMLTQDEVTDEFRVLANGKSYKVLLASITYFKGEVGDEVVILVPKDKSSTWAAVENIVKGGENLEKKSNDKEESVIINDEKEESKQEDKKQLDEIDHLAKI